MSQWSGPECLFLYIQSTKPKLFKSMCGLHCTSGWRIWPGRLEIWYGILWMGRLCFIGWFSLQNWCTCWVVGKGEGNGLWGKKLGRGSTRVSLLAVLTLRKQVKLGQNTKISILGIDSCEKRIIILGGHAWRKVFLACSKLVTMAIYVVKQACRHECMLQVNNHEIIVNFYLISHNLTWYVFSNCP